MLRYRVPASTTNLGHGFDCLGMALGLYNEVTLDTGPGSGAAHEHAPGLLALSERVRALADARWPSGGPLPLLHPSVRGDVPIARGLGSSATIIVALALAYQALAGVARDPDSALGVAAAAEGHPDNVAAACLGGFTLAGEVDGAIRTARFAAPRGLCAVLAIPSFEVKTSDARRILPPDLTRGDAVRALQRTALIVAALARSDGPALRGLFTDAWHERFRVRLNPDLEECRRVADAAGALGTHLSGSGSTILSIVPSALAEAVAARLRSACTGRERPIAVHIASFSDQGAERLDA